MRKLLVVVFALLSTASYSQDKKPAKSRDLINRAGDHFMIQLSSDHWLSAPDSISDRIRSISRGANVYLMLNKPFRANPKFSIGFGIGVGTSNIFFKKMSVEIASTENQLPFNALDSTFHFKKFKLTSAFLEIPLELRFMAKPEDPDKSIKVAIGVKGGTLLNVHTKGKTLQDAAGNTALSYTAKQSTKAYFNSTRLAATARIGYGIYNLFAAYNLTPMFKEGVASDDVKLLQVGLAITGL
jgi:hypothetical protein